jgi:hypothetical protein
MAMNVSHDVDLPVSPLPSKERFKDPEHVRFGARTRPIAVKLRSSGISEPEPQAWSNEKSLAFAGLLAARSAGLEPATF